MAPKAKSSKAKTSKTKSKAKPETKTTKSKIPSLDYRKVRKVMKQHNSKKMDKEAVKKIASELNFPLKDLSHELLLRGKMLASIRTWDKE